MEDNIMKIRHFVVEEIKQTQKNYLAKKCHPVAVDSFGTEMTIEDVVFHVSESELLVLGYEKKELIVFGSFVIIKNNICKILYMHGVCVAAYKQGCGIVGRIVDYANNLVNADFLALRTQNPRLYKALKKQFRSGIIYPSLANEALNEDVISMGQYIVASLDRDSANYDCDGMLFRQVYSECLYQSIPFTGDDEVDEIFRKKLNLVDGKSRDALLLIIPSQ